MPVTFNQLNLLPLRKKKTKLENKNRSYKLLFLHGGILQLVYSDASLTMIGIKLRVP